MDTIRAAEVQTLSIQVRKLPRALPMVTPLREKMAHLYKETNAVQMPALMNEVRQYLASVNAIVAAGDRLRKEGALIGNRNNRRTLEYANKYREAQTLLKGAMASLSSAKSSTDPEAVSRHIKTIEDAMQKVTQILKLYALKGVELPRVFVSAGAGGTAGAARGAARLLALTLAGLMLLGGAAWQIYAYRAKVHYKLLSRAAVALPNPSGFVVTNDGVWFSDWIATPSFASTA